MTANSWSVSWRWRTALFLMLLWSLRVHVGLLFLVAWGFDFERKQSYYVDYKQLKLIREYSTLFETATSRTPSFKWCIALSSTCRYIRMLPFLTARLSFIFACYICDETFLVYSLKCSHMFNACAPCLNMELQQRHQQPELKFLHCVIESQQT